MAPRDTGTIWGGWEQLAGSRAFRVEIAQIHREHPQVVFASPISHSPLHSPLQLCDGHASPQTLTLTLTRTLTLTSASARALAPTRCAQAALLAPAVLQHLPERDQPSKARAAADRLQQPHGLPASHRRADHHPGDAVRLRAGRATPPRQCRLTTYTASAERSVVAPRPATAASHPVCRVCLFPLYVERRDQNTDEIVSHICYGMSERAETFSLSHRTSSLHSGGGDLLFTGSCRTRRPTPRDTRARATLSARG